MGKDRVLVVDDDPDNLAMIGHFLANWGYDVDDAKNGREALEKIEANPPSLVLLDLEMPEMDGFETCERLKTDPETEWIPVIIFTGLENMPNRIRGFQHGADDYVVKTVEPDALRSRIEHVLERSKRYATLATAPAGASHETSPAAAIEEEPAAAAGDFTLSVSLSQVPFPEAMKLVLALGKDGIAHVSREDRRGIVHVQDGGVSHVALGEEQGNEAFYELALWRSGRFEFQDTEPGGERSILTSTRSLLVEASRRLDAWTTISSKVKSFESTPKWVPLDVDSIRLTSSDWAVLRLVDGRRSIRDIVDELNTDMFEAGRVVHNLVTVGVLRLDEGADREEEVFELVPRRGETVRTSEPFELGPAEWDLLRRTDGSRTLGSIRESMNLPAQEFLKMARDLKAKGFLQLVGREQRKRRGA